MDLIICNTPLQIIQIEKLITNGIIKEKNFYFVFFVCNETEKLKYYYDRLAKLSKDSLYYKYQKFPFYIFSLRKIFKKNKYENIYTASVDNKLIHYILSFTQFNGLYTIDDGAANIWNKSNYYINKKSTLKKLVHQALGCKFDLEKTKKRINTHYTIYKDMPNITKYTKYNNPFPQYKQKNHIIESEVNIYLGTVYNEITYDKSALLDSLNNFFDKKNFFCISHPRDTFRYFDNLNYIEGNEIAEEIILNLLEKYSRVNLYGFGSSVQFNLLKIDGIQNYQFTSSKLKFNINIENHFLKKIDLD
ncbi:glycosyltransferase family 52 [Providencia manganoxydans]|uniref:glycosyltransferase family 52 n=1 Tax=Providencia manganoxydans TaxID=2923283 RepID=UPI0034E43F97